LAFTPLILLAGLVAVVAVTAVALGRHTRVEMPIRRRSASAFASVLRLESSSAESSLGVMGRRAA